jgi:uncharacterized membrane protein YozB (DUF420 family)
METLREEGEPFMLTAIFWLLAFVVFYLGWTRYAYSKAMEEIGGKPPFSYLSFQVFGITMACLLSVGPLMRMFVWRV